MKTFFLIFQKKKNNTFFSNLQLLVDNVLDGERIIIFQAIVMFILWIYEKKFGPTGVRKPPISEPSEARSISPDMTVDLEDEDAPLIDNMTPSHYRHSPSIVIETSNQTNISGNQSVQTGSQQNGQQRVEVQEAITSNYISGYLFSTCAYLGTDQTYPSVCVGTYGSFMPRRPAIYRQDSLGWHSSSA